MIGLDSEIDSLYKLLIGGDSRPHEPPFQTNTKNPHISHQPPSISSINKVCTIPMQAI